MTTVTLSERARAIVEQQLKGGDYENAAEVVDAALALFHEQDTAYWVEVNRKIDEGLEAAAAGQVVPWHAGSIAEIRALADELLHRDA